MWSKFAAVLTSVVVLLAIVPATAGAASETTSASVTATQLVLPDSTGSERVGAVSLHLVDRSHSDPWVRNKSVRKIMVQIWYPGRSVRSYPVAHWVSPGVAELINPPGTPVILPVTHAYVGAPVANGSHPVVLYSPGFGGERTSITGLVEGLASHGHIVVTIDHTYDAPWVEFPDGRIETNTIPQPTDPADEERIIAKALETRMANTRFTLNQLAAMNRGHNPDEGQRPLPRGLIGALDLSRIGVFGHSLGGAVAAEAMLEDGRIMAGLNMDGTVSGPVVAAGLDRPFLLMGSDGHDGESWSVLWAQLRGSRYLLQLVGSGHLSFTDYNLLLPQAGVPPEALVLAFGTIDGERSIAVQRAYVRAFFDRHLRRGSTGKLAGPSPRYSETRFMA